MMIQPKLLIRNVRFSEPRGNRGTGKRSIDGSAPSSRHSET